MYDKKNLLRLVLYPLLFVSILYFGQDKFLLHPSVVTKNSPGARPALATAWVEAGHFHGLVYEPANEVNGTVLFFHGNAGAAHHRDSISEFLTTAGYRLVIVEYPGFGERTGVPTLTNIKNSANVDLHLAHSRWPGPLYVMGESLGAGIAAQVAGATPKLVSGVLLFTPWDSLEKVVDAKFFGIPIHILLKEKLDSTVALRHFPGKVTIVGARMDTLIPVAHARILVDSISRARYLELEHAGHNDWKQSMSSENWKWALESFK